MQLTEANPAHRTPASARIMWVLLMSVGFVVASAADVAPAGAATWRARPSPPWRGVNRWEANGFAAPAESFPVKTVLVGDPPAGVSVEAVESSARQAARRWTEVPCSAARIRYVGRRQTLAELQPDETPVVFADPTQVACFPTDAIGWTALVCGGPYPDKTVFLNTAAYDWTDQPRPFQPATLHPDASPPRRLTVDVQSVLTHEFGHVLGLSHAQDSLATMAPTYRADGGQRQLAVDDKRGICALYPVGDPPDQCFSGRDCPLRQQCSLVDQTRLCAEVRGGVGDACRLDRLTCTETCVLADNPRDFGYCSRPCGGTAARCPPGFWCVEADGNDQGQCRRREASQQAGCSAVGRDGPKGRLSWAILVGLLALVGVWRIIRRSWTLRPFGTPHNRRRGALWEKSRPP